MLKKLDWLIIMIIAVFGLLLCVMNFSNVFHVKPQNVKSLTVSIDGKLEKTFRFSEEFSKTYTIHSKFGYNILEIKNGEAYIRDADCGTRLCVFEGKISKVGDFIICLPHKLIIQIEGESDVDAISY